MSNVGFRAVGRASHRVDEPCFVSRFTTCTWRSVLFRVFGADSNDAHYGQ